MIYVTLDDVKGHLRISGTAEDALLTNYANAAEAYVTRVADDTTSSDMVRAVVLLLVGDLYENREANTEKVLTGNPTVDRLLATMRNSF